MQAFRESAIRRKLIGILMLTSGAAWAVAWVAFGVYDALTFRHALVRDLATLTEIVGLNADSALASSDRGAASQVLSTLRAQPSIMAAGAYSREGEILADYHRANVSIPLPPKILRGEEGISTLHQLALFHRVIRNGVFGRSHLCGIGFEGMERTTAAQCPDGLDRDYRRNRV